MNIVESGAQVFHVSMRLSEYYVNTMGEDPWNLPTTVSIGYTMRPHKAKQMKKQAAKKRLEIEKHIMGYYEEPNEMAADWEEDTFKEILDHIDIEKVSMDEFTDSDHFDEYQYG